MATITIKTHEEWVTMATEYKETGSQDVLTDLFMGLRDLAVNIGKRQHQKYKYLGVDQMDFVNEAEFAVFDAIEKYDPEKGNLPAMVKNHIVWKISDNIVRPANTKKGKFERNVQYLDQTVNGDGTTLLDVVEDQIKGTDESAFDVVEEEDGIDLVAELEEMLNAFEETVKKSDSDIVRAVFDVIMSNSVSTAVTVNKELYVMFPEVAKATLRKRKGRALEKFTEFAKLNGFDSTDMSQF